MAFDAAIGENAGGCFNKELSGKFRPETGFDKAARVRKDGASATCTVGIAGNNINETLVDHPPGNMLGTRTELPQKRASRQLHETSIMGKLLEHGVVRFDPRQTLGMGDDGNEPAVLYLGDSPEESRRWGDVGWFKQEIERVVQGKGMAGLDFRNRMGRQMDVGPCRDLQGDARLDQLLLEVDDHTADSRSWIVKKTRQQMRRARGHANSVINRNAGHLQGNVKRTRAIVNSREHMAVKVDHGSGSHQRQGRGSLTLML